MKRTYCRADVKSQAAVLVSEPAPSDQQTGKERSATTLGEGIMEGLVFAK